MKILEIEALVHKLTQQRSKSVKKVESITAQCWLRAATVWLNWYSKSSISLLLTWSWMVVYFIQSNTNKRTQCEIDLQYLTLLYVWCLICLKFTSSRESLIICTRKWSDVVMGSDHELMDQRHLQWGGYLCYEFVFWMWICGGKLQEDR